MSEVKGRYVSLLIELLKLGAKEEPIEATTKSLAKIIGKSQQAMSIYLRELESNGLISRTRMGNKSFVKLTKKGVEELELLYRELKPYFEKVPKIVKLEGRVFSGYGEGAYYMSKEGYREQFKKKLGFYPYPGTLNLRLDEPYKEVRKALEGLPSILIEGFKNENRTYGWLKVIPALVDETPAAVLISLERSHYGDDVLEVVSKFNLRDRLKLKDGDLVKVKVVFKSG